MGTKFKPLPETWPLSKYEVSIDGKIIGVVGQYQETLFVRWPNKATLQNKTLWYAGVEGPTGWTQRSLATRKKAVEILKSRAS